MNKNFRLSAIAKSVIRASTTVVAAGTLLSPLAAFAAPSPTGMIEANNGTHHFWMIDKANGTGIINKGDANQNVYFSHAHRKDNDTQTLLVKGGELTGHYINGSDNGTANVIMTQKATTDYIEFGNARSTTNAHVLLMNSTLTGPKENQNYDNKPSGASVPDKNYLNGAAIYLDRQDKGNLTVGLLDHSHVIGNISAGQDGKKDVLIDDSSLEKGGVVFDGASVNTVTMHNGNIDATGRKGDDKDYAISLANAKTNTLNISKNSMLNGGIHLSGSGHTDDVTVQDSFVRKLDGSSANAIDISGAHQAGVNVKGSYVTGDVKLTQVDSAHVNLVDSYVRGNMNIDALKHADVTLKGTGLDGTLTLSGTAPQNVTLTRSAIMNGIDAHDVAGDMHLVIADHSAVLGNVTMAKGNNTLVLDDYSAVEGDLKGGSGHNSLYMGKASVMSGKTAGFGTITTTADNLIQTPTLSHQTVVLRNNSLLHTEALEDVTIDTDTSGHFNVTSSVKGHNVVTVSEVASDTSEGIHQMTNLPGKMAGTLDMKFANKRQNVSARQGAYDVDLSLKTQHKTTSAKPAYPEDEETLVNLQVTKRGLASDVKGAIAGLEGARQDLKTVTSSIANRMNTLNTSQLLYGVHEGADVWGDYLGQSGDGKAAVDYHHVMKGTVIGMDWTWLLDGRNSLTTGLSFGETRDKVSGKGTTDSFKNTLKGNYYSVYGSWQQGLDQRPFGFFANGVASYGDITYALTSQNVGSTTNGMTETLKSGYKGKAYNAEVRTGVNYAPIDAVILQPYAVVGWSKATANAFDNQYVHFNANENASWYAGGGARITGNIAVGHMKLMPWADASYVSEFKGKETFTANAQAVSQGKTRRYGLFGAGVNAGLTDSLSMNVGAYTGAGDMRDGVSLQAGMKYSF